MGPSHLSQSAQAFLSLASRADLAQWLGLTDRQLRYLLYVLPQEKKYKTFKIAKKNGGVRIIDAPLEGLKAIQRRLMRAFVEIAPPTILAKAYVTGLSTIDHAWLHRRRRNVALVDIADFFPSITFQRVRGALLAAPFLLPPKVATCVAQLCCKDGSLPQGAPTSPVISNLICRSLDGQLIRLAKKHRFSVSRYADDICISTSKSSFSDQIVDKVGRSVIPGAELSSVFSRAGFAINQEKFKLSDTQTRQLVTGLVVNKGVSLPRVWRRQLRVLLHLVNKHGEDRAGEVVAGWGKRGLRGDFTSISQVIRGKANFAQHVDKRCGRMFSESLFRCYPEQRGLLPRPIGGVAFRVMSEGKTDLLHLEAAHSRFLERGEFGQLRPRFLNFAGDVGDVELMKTLLRIAKSEIPELTIGVFDCDSPKFMRDNSLAPGSFVRLGQSVYAVCLAPASSCGSLFCVESLYEKSDLTLSTSDGRRIFVRDDFDASGLSLDGKYRRAAPAATSIIVSDSVERLADGFSSALSKAKFAELVHAKSPPFDQVSFEGFRDTFKVIESVVDHWLSR